MSQLIVTHKSPDLDAIGSVWLLKRFDAQHFADAKVQFVPAGQSISEDQLDQLGIDAANVTHVDTGLGPFDHHQPERGHEFICAASLVYNDHLCHVHPELQDDKALQAVVAFITEIDHFQEIFWPDADHDRYSFMLPELIHGLESQQYHNDDSQLHYGMTSLDAAYAKLKSKYAALESIAQNGQPFSLAIGECLAIETHNDDTIKLAQRMGKMLVVKRDLGTGHIRIKARPDAQIDLKKLADAIIPKDPHANWYYHPSGKMLLNNSSKTTQKPSQLSLETVVAMIKEIYD